MTSPQKAKGSSWERHCCSLLSESMGGNFMRVPNSGAYTGRTNAHRKDNMSDGQILLARGDIIPPDEYPNFVAECKFYKDFKFHQLYTNNCPQLDEWIGQTLDCVDEGNFWLLMIKINRRGSFVVFDEKYKSKFDLQSYTCYKSYIFTDLETFLTHNKEHIKVLSQ